jgi:predicted DCC family thiol-disulfide oxidoreductase YuxK
MHSIISKLYDKKIDAAGLGIFRIAYSLVLLCEVIQLYYFRHLIFDKIPYLSPSEVDFGPALLAWMIIIIFLMLGLYTKVSAIINYLFSLTFIATISSYEYHMFYVYMAINFLMIFIDVSKVNSLDRLRLKLKYSNTRFNYVPIRTISVLNYHILVLVSIAFVYFDSVFYKFDSKIWLNGLGMWLPASFPNLVHTNTTLLLNIKWLVLSLGYLTLLFETLFILTFFRKKWRVPLMIIGIGLHIGILVEFPIPWFALGVTGSYLLMVPVSFWRKIRSRLRFKKTQLTFFYDEGCPLCNRTVIILSHLDYFNAISFKGVQTHGFNAPQLVNISHDELLDNIYSIKKRGTLLVGVDTYKYALKLIPSTFIIGLLLSVPGIYQIAKWIYRKIATERFVQRCSEENCGYIPPSLPIDHDQIKLNRKYTIKDLKISLIVFGLYIIFFLQLIVTYNSPIAKKMKIKIGFEQSYIDKKIMVTSIKLENWAKRYVGITHHAVFMDYHFDGYNHIIALVAEDKNGIKYWLPIIDRKGFADMYIYGFNWVKWTFRANAPHINNKNLKTSVRDFTSFWAFKNGKNPKDLKYFIYVKKVDSATEWKKDFLQDQINKPWIIAGFAFWKNNDFKWQVVDIEGI